MVVTDKIKGLLPSLREKKRYIVFSVASLSSHSLPAVKQAILDHAHALFGVFGAARMGVVFLPDWKKQKGIVRVSHTSVDMMKSVFVLLDRINDTSVRVQSHFVSGSLAPARRKIGGGNYICNQEQ